MSTKNCFVVVSPFYMHAYIISLKITLIFYKGGVDLLQSKPITVLTYLKMYVDGILRRGSWPQCFTHHNIHNDSIQYGEFTWKTVSYEEKYGNLFGDFMLSSQPKVFGLSALAVEAYGITLVHSSVRASHHIWRSAHQILMIFCTKLHLDKTKKMFQADFWKKFSFSIFWPKTANFCHIWPFLAQKSGFWTFSSNQHIKFV